MKKQEAINAMKQGQKVTHRYFSDNEWMTMKDGYIHLEDGVKCKTFEFWRWRNDGAWDDGYSIFN